MILRTIEGEYTICHEDKPIGTVHIYQVDGVPVAQLQLECRLLTLTEILKDNGTALAEAIASRA